MPPSMQSFEEAAAEKRSSILGEFVGFLLENKKWWLLPIFLVLLGMGALVVLGGGPLAPYIYTLF